MKSTSLPPRYFHSVPLTSPEDIKDFMRPLQTLDGRRVTPFKASEGVYQIHERNGTKTLVRYYGRHACTVPPLTSPDNLRFLPAGGPLVARLHIEDPRITAARKVGDTIRATLKAACASEGARLVWTLLNGRDLEVEAFWCEFTRALSRQVRDDQPIAARKAILLSTLKKTPHKDYGAGALWDALNQISSDDWVILAVALGVIPAKPKGAAFGMLPGTTEAKLKIAGSVFSTPRR